MREFIVLAALTVFGFLVAADAWKEHLALLRKPRPREHILLFGDSLTAGYHGKGHTIKYHPYSIQLERLLQKHGYPVQVHQWGKSGERVLGGMTARLPQVLAGAEERGLRFSWVVIMGGINDIWQGASAEDIVAGLRSLYAASWQHGARVLALTCLETELTAREAREAPRQRLNELIRREVAGIDFITLLDAEKLLPYTPPGGGPGGDAGAAAAPGGAALWDDHVHLTPAGYDQLGGLVFEALRGQLNSTQESR